MSQAEVILTSLLAVWFVVSLILVPVGIVKDTILGSCISQRSAILRVNPESVVKANADFYECVKPKTRSYE